MQSTEIIAQISFQVNYPHPSFMLEALTDPEGGVVSLGQYGSPLPMSLSSSLQETNGSALKHSTHLPPLGFDDADDAEFAGPKGSEDLPTAKVPTKDLKAMGLAAGGKLGISQFLSPLKNKTSYRI
jgi:hypothetical protein